jgi:hypothetical protein
MLNKKSGEQSYAAKSEREILYFKNNSFVYQHFFVFSSSQHWSSNKTSLALPN